MKRDVLTNLFDNQEEKKDLEYFKSQTFYKFAKLFSLIALLPICYGAYMFFKADYIIIGFVELLIYLVIVLLLLNTRVSITVKRYILVLSVFLLGLILLFTVGPMGGGLVVMVSTLGIAACLLSKRQSEVFIFISLFVFIVISVLLHFGFLDNLAIYQYRESWYIVAISAQSMGTLFVLIINTIFSNIENQIEEIEKRKSIIEESERSKSMLLSNLPGLAYRCNYDHKWTMQFVSSGCLGLTGYIPDSLLDNRDLSYNDLIVPKYRSSIWDEWESALVKKLPCKCEYEIVTATGERKWVLETGQGIYNEQGEVDALEGIILDISDKKQIENDLRYINEHDRGTGLYNRDYLEQLLEKDAKKQDASKRAVISINLSTVQLLTANYGFRYTQALIKEAAVTLSKYCTDNLILFQTYGNQFVFYIKDYKDKSELIDFSEALADTLESLFAMDKINGGIGILEIGQDDVLNVDLLLRKLLIASEQSMNIFEKDFRTCFCDEGLEAIVSREGEIRQELSRIATANTGDDLYLQYQPIMDLKTNSICGFEALARLRTEKLGLVSPVEFIPIAEETKLIIPIGEKIILSAFRFLNRLKEVGYEKIAVSINVSAIQLLRPDFNDRLFEMINEMQVNPVNIAIEITESVFTFDYENINNVIGKLRDAGIHIDIDDFGTGYSSLSRVKELGADCLKIDKSFIDKLLNEHPDKAITGDIISMAHKLGHCAIAEGVEYESQLQYLRDNHCDKIQGYLIGKPLDEKETLELLKKQRK